LRKTRYEQMLVSDLVAARAEAPLVYVPIGSTEYHGFHLPLGFDAINAHELCLRAAQETGGVVLPPTYWGTRGHETFEGSLLLKEGTIATLVRDVLSQLRRLRYRLIVLFTGHHPDVQGVLLKRVADEFMAANPAVRVEVLDPFYIYPNELGIEHAGKQETSMMLYLRPELVDMAKLKLEGALDAISKDCVEATPEFGRELVEKVVTALVARVRAALEEMAGASK